MKDVPTFLILISVKGIDNMLSELELVNRVRQRRTYCSTGVVRSLCPQVDGHLFALRQKCAGRGRYFTGGVFKDFQQYKIFPFLNLALAHG